MNEERLRQWMMERLYGEIRPEDDRALDDALSQSPELAQEWQDAQAAHQMLQQIERPEAPLSLQYAIQQAARGVPAEPPSSFRWRRWLTAAVVLIASGVVFLQWNGNLPKNISDETAQIQSPEIAMAPQFKLQVEAPNLESTRMMKIAQDTDSNEAFTLATSKGHIEHKASEKREAEAEELFRTGLGVYNQAFTKIGDDRLTLLKSAVITLGDVVKQYSEQKEWTALAMTLIADSHRALDEIVPAIETYQQLIASCPESDLVCTQARISLIELLLTQDDRDDEIDQHLNQLSPEKKKSDEFAALALTASSKIGERNPEQAFAWAQQVMAEWPPQHIYHQKAQRFAQQFQDAALSVHTVTNWWMLGPLPNFATRIETLPPISSRQSVPGFKNRAVVWKKTKIKKNTVDLTSPLVQDDAGRTVFLSTNIQSPEPQVIILALHTNALAHLFVNQDMVWKSGNQIPWRIIDSVPARYEIQCSLKKGANPILLKMFFPSGKTDTNHFTVTILDTDHNIKRDLTASY